MKLHHYNEAYAHMVRRAKFADGTPKPLPKPERNFADKLKTLKEVSKGISPESRLRLLDYFIQEALTKGQLTEEQASGIYNQLREDKDKIREQIDTYINQNKLTDETSKEYVQALIDNVKEEKLSKEYLEHWTCDHCGEHTHEVDYDYLGNGTNHLGCELKLEMGEKN